MVPKEWKEGVIEDIAKVSSGGTPSRNEKDYWDSGNVPWIRTTEVQNCVLNYEDVQEFITKKGLESSSAKLVPAGTLLMAMIGQGKTRGQVALLNFEATTNQNCATILLKKNNSPEFYFNYLLSKYERIRNWSNSAGQSNLSGALVKSIPILIPPLSEQQKIAKVLSTWDKAISTTERLIENSAEQKKVLMQQLLTGKKRLLDESGKPFEGEWDEVKLSSLAKSGKGNFTDGDWIESPHITEDGCRLIQTGNIGVGYFKNKNKRYISETSFNELKCTEVKVGDLLICRLAEPAGRACVVPDIGEEKMLTSVDVAIMNVDKAKSSAKYLSYYFSLEHTLYLVSALCGGSTRSRVSRTNLGTMKILLPDVIEQQKIATVLTNADKEIELLEQQLADLQQEKKALMQVLLTGKKRVVVDGEV